MEQILNILSKSGIDKLLLGIAALVVCLLVSNKLLLLYDHFSKNLKQYINSSLRTLIRAILRVLMYALSIGFSASIIGIPVTSLVALFSVVGLSISLAVQGLLANFAGGIIILVSKPFQVGDYIEGDTVCGTVEKISYLHTMLSTPDGKRIYIPNNTLYTTRMTNYTSYGKHRMDLPVSASYNNTPSQVRHACIRAVEGIREILKTPAPDVVLVEYGDNSIQYTIRAWVKCDDYQQYMNVRYKLNEALYNSFKDNNVEMTYPHINVHMQEN